MLNINTEKYDFLVIMHVRGKCDNQSVKTFRKSWYEQMAKGPGAIAINCSDIEFIDSSTIRALVNLSKIAVLKEIELILYDLGNQMEHIFSQASVSGFLRVMSKDEFETVYSEQLRDPFLESLNAALLQ
ncbi:MAG: STAS domain-containing protein [bacterium]|nr:STAS domain-containing protein [bacterium]